ncbi:Isocitrate dehydrogenase [NAD] subunit, mitochondrial [Aphelenchoides besseyi]|nr:Isocitrate dehydrogenase [NAD] subunit, mitochondrial [Aphelenchoides besseyi]
MFVFSFFINRRFQSSQNIRIVDCTYNVGPKPDYKKFREESYGKFKELQSRMSAHKATFLKSHLPGSVHFDIDVGLYPGKFERFSVYEPEVFQEYARLLGINNEDHLGYGHEKLSLLDGGFSNWQNHGFDVESTAGTDYPPVKEGNFTAQNELDRFYIRFEEFNRQGGVLDKPESANLLDSRIRAQFDGKQDTGLDPNFVSGTRIRGTTNVPAAEFLNAEGTLRPLEEIRKDLFRNYKPEKPTITFCNAGMQASLAAEIASYGGRYTVTALPGDGIGPEMLEHIQRIFHFAHVPVDFEIMPMSSDLESDDLNNAMISIRRNGVALKGNIETKFDNPEFKSRNMELRRLLDLYANVIHCVSIPTVHARHNDLNIVMIRENTEGEYSGLEHRTYDGVVESLKVAGEMAANEYKDIEFDTMIVDNASMQLGNIISNIACGLVGGPGLTSGMNIGDKYAVFETGTRNTGSSLVGNDIANPTAFIRASADLLCYLSLTSYANLITDALFRALTVDRVHTRDIGGDARSSDVIESVLKHIEHEMRVKGKRIRH